MSREVLDELYNTTSAKHTELETALATYGASRLEHEIRAVFSIAREIVESFSNEPYTLRDALRTRRSGNPIKGPFYAFYMALFELVVREELTPSHPPEVMKKLDGVVDRLKTDRHHTTEEDRRSNVDVIKGLIRPLFTHKQPPVLRSGSALLYDFENAMRRSSVESSRYECKQGVLNLDGNREKNAKLVSSIPEILCAIANVGPDSDGYLFFGVADTEADAKRVLEVDDVSAIQIGNRHVVGVNREASVLAKGIEGYVRELVTVVSSSQLSDPCKTQVLSNVETITYRGFDVARFRIPAQVQPSYVGDDMFIRKGSSTVKASASLDFHGPVLS